MDTKDRATMIVHPVILFFGYIGIGYGLDKMFPFRLHLWEGYSRVIVSGILMVFAFLVVGLSFLALHRHRTPIDPMVPTVAIVQEGPYRFTRNPLFLAEFLLFSGLNVLMASIWWVLLFPVWMVLIHFGVVKCEERYLEQKFGEEYLLYKKKVRRWL